MLAVIDYGAGNLYSVCNTLDYLNIPHTVTADAGAGKAGGAHPAAGVPKAAAWHLLRDAAPV